MDNLDREKIRLMFKERTGGKSLPFPIKITCEAKEYHKYSEIADLQEGLKTRTEDDIVKILKSIHDFGFSFPILYADIKGVKLTLDGHGRQLAFAIYEELGGVVPVLPCVKIEAKNRTEAKQKLLRFNSQFGTVDKDGFAVFMKDLDIDFDDINIPDIDVRDYLEEVEKQNQEPIEVAPPTVDENVMNHEKFYISFSGGKDSTMALFRMAPLLKALNKKVEMIYVDTGVEFPDMLAHVYRVAEIAGIPLTVLQSKKNFFEVYYKKKVFPDSIYRDCIGTLISDTIDNYCTQDKEPYVLVRGGRTGQKTRISKSAGVQLVKGKPLMTIYNPLFDMSEDLFQEELKKLPLWEGYAKGFDRTACWCCPFQKAGQFDALKEHYPFLYNQLEHMFKVMHFKEHKGDSYLKNLNKYWGDIRTC